MSLLRVLAAVLFLLAGLAAFGWLLDQSVDRAIGLVALGLLAWVVLPKQLTSYHVVSGPVNDLRDTCEPDGAADRAARAARTLAAIAHDAARKYVQRDAVAPQTDGADPDVMPSGDREIIDRVNGLLAESLDTAEAARQARLRRWHEPPHPNRKGG
jgi:hypothetical protein